MRTVRLRPLCAAVLLCALSVVLADTPGDAQAAIETGWWWKGNPGTAVPLPSALPVPQQYFPADLGGLPPPPNVGGGLMVGALPDGAFSIAAVRTSLNAESLTLTAAANGNVNGQMAHLLACQSSFPWNANAGGRWDDKPLVACDVTNGGASVAGIPSADFNSWTFPVAPLIVDGALDVVIVPAAGTLPNGLLEPFQLVFDPPQISSFVINPTVPTVDDATDDVDDTEDTSVFGDGSSSDLGIGGGNLSSFATDQTFAPAAAAALPPASQAPQLFTPAATTVPANTSSAQLLALLLLLGVAAAAWATTRQELPAPLSLSRVAARPRSRPSAEPTTGGLGRFARTRSGRPPSLF